MNLIPRKLALKLILFLTVIVALAEGISGYVNLKNQEHRLLEAMIVGADQLSKSITSATWHAMLADHREAAYQMMQTIALKQGIKRIRMFNKEGRVMFSTIASDEVQVDKYAEACYFCHASEKPLVNVDAPSRSRIVDGPDGGRQLALVTPIYNEPACSQAACHAHPAATKVVGVLDVALDLEPVDSEVRRAEIRAILVTGIHIVLISLFIVLFTRYVVGKPIRKLIAGTRAVSAMQLDKPIQIDTSDELGELARSFNIMRERLAAAINEINQFTQSLEIKVEERTEQLKIAHQKLFQSDRLASLGQLSASVAHEINNPLSGVLNLSMLMQRIIANGGIPPERLPEFRKYLAQVVNETARVGRIVSDLLAFSRRSKPHSAPADLNAIIKTTLSLLAHKLKLSNVETVLTLEENLPAVHCDNSQMQQVIINLVMNAAEATHSRGQGQVCVNTKFKKESGEVILEIKDNGEGIPPENLTKIFDPFFTTKGEGKGVGLGLSVIYGIIEAHGGDIEVKSKVGEGTTFIVTLPLTREKTATGEETTATGHRQ